MKRRITGLEIMEHGKTFFTTPTFKELYISSGARNVISANIQPSRPDFRIDAVDVEIVFSSYFWTGRNGNWHEKVRMSG